MELYAYDIKRDGISVPGYPTIQTSRSSDTPISYPGRIRLTNISGGFSCVAPLRIVEYNLSLPAQD